MQSTKRQERKREGNKKDVNVETTIYNELTYDVFSCLSANGLETILSLRLILPLTAEGEADDAAKRYFGSLSLSMLSWFMSSSENLGQDRKKDER